MSEISSDSELDDIDYLGRTLLSSSRMMRRTSLLCLLITILNFGVLGIGVPFVVTSLSSYSGSYSRFLVQVVTVSSTITTLMALLLLGYLDSQKKRADALFNELSEQIEGHAGRSLEQVAPVPSRIRLAMRESTRSGELPLTSGKSGYLVYAFVNIALTIVTIVLAIQVV